MVMRIVVTRRRDNPDDEQHEGQCARDCGVVLDVTADRVVFQGAWKNWCELTLTAFLYLEDLRARQLARRGLSEDDKKMVATPTDPRPLPDRATRQPAERIHVLGGAPGNLGGIQKLKRLLRAGFAPEYRSAL